MGFGGAEEGEGETLGAELKIHMDDVMEHALRRGFIAKRWHGVLRRFAHKAVGKVQHFSRLSKDSM